MASLNKVMLIGRLTNSPEARSFANGGKVTKFGFAVNDRRKNQNTGEYEDVPMFIDIEAFDTKTRDLGSQAEKHFCKGKQLFIEGRLRLDQWEKDGQKRSKLLVVLDNYQYLDEAGARKKQAEAPAFATTESDGSIPF